MKISLGLIVVLVFSLSCGQKSQISQNIEGIVLNGWYDTTFYKDEFHDGRKSKYKIYQYFLNDELIYENEISTLQGDTIRISNIVVRYFKPVYLEYNYYWSPDLTGKMNLVQLFVSDTAYAYDTIYFFYVDKSIKYKGYDFNPKTMEKTKFNYKKGEYFIDLQRIDTLPGVIPTEYYYLME
jgi:hypothetical protein